MNLDWRAQPYLKDERDQRFFAGAAVHNRWPTLAQFTCCAVVRGRRCNRIIIVETGHKHCIKHAGPTAANAYRENCRRLFERGRLRATKWFKDEQRRQRTRIRDRQRRKRGGWVLPGLTLRFAPEIEGRFRDDAQERCKGPAGVPQPGAGEGGNRDEQTDRHRSARFRHS
jgi:hypothetical protein